MTTYDPTRELEDMARAIDPSSFGENPLVSNTSVTGQSIARYHAVAARSASHAHRLLPALQAELAEARADIEQMAGHVEHFCKHNKDLQAEKERLRKMVQQAVGTADELRDKIIKLQARVKEMEDALQRIVAFKPDYAKEISLSVQAANYMQQQAKQALRADEQKG